MQKTRICSFFNFVSVWATLLVPVVALLVFIPVAPLWVEGSKVLLGGLLISVAAVAYVLEGFFAKRFSLPHKQVLVGAGLYGATVLVSTLFAQGGQFSLFGIGVEAWTVAHIFAGLLFFMLVAVHAENAAVRNKFVTFLVVGAIVAVVFQLVRILSLGAVSFSIFADPVTNTLGRWYDMGIISLIGLIASLFVFAITKEQNRVGKISAAVIFVAFTLFFFISSPLIGLLLLVVGGLFMAALLKGISDQDSSRARFSHKVFLTLSFVAIAFFVFQGLVGRSPLFYQSQITPTLSQTRADIAYRDFPITFFSDSFSVVKGVVKESPVFGVGAARFQEAWAQYKPVSINQTAWWATDFGIGSGIVVTVLVSFGLLGLLGLLAFLFVVFKGILRGLTSQVVNEKILAFFAAILWIYALVQTPSAGLMLVIFTVTGLVFSFGAQSSINVSQSSHRILALVVAVVAVSLPVYGSFSRTLALSYALQGSREVATDLVSAANAEQLLNKAAAIVPHGVYYQALAIIQERILGQLSAKIANKDTSEAEKSTLSAQFKAKTDQTTSTYTKSIQANEKDYVSYFKRAQFLSNFIGQGDDATIFAIALEDVKKARSLAPTNATVDILEAQLHLLKNNGNEAQNLLLQAINKKPNYTDPALLLAQLKIQQKNYQDALVAAEYAVRTNVNSSQALYIYGVLQFEAKNYLAAAQAFERILVVERNVPLELGRLLADSYVQIGNLEGARQAYEALLKADPNNSEIQSILMRIQEATSASKVETTPQQ